MVGKREMAQAAIYPRFLQPRLSMSEALTAAEMQVLQLICAEEQRGDRGDPEHPGLHGQEPCEQRAQ